MISFKKSVSISRPKSPSHLTVVQFHYVKSRRKRLLSCSAIIIILLLHTHISKKKCCLLAAVLKAVTQLTGTKDYRLLCIGDQTSLTVGVL